MSYQNTFTHELCYAIKTSTRHRLTQPLRALPAPFSTCIMIAPFA